MQHILAVVVAEPLACPSLFGKGQVAVGKTQRRPIAPTDDWDQLQLLTTFPEQQSYELLRPIVLFGQSPAERARQTRTPERTLYRRAARFERVGMASLFETPVRSRDHRTLPRELREAIRQLAAEEPALRPYEIAAICGVVHGRRPSPHTVKRVLAETPPTPVRTRRFPPYHQIADPVERRLAIVRLHSEGWIVSRIASYLDVDRTTVYRTLRRWIDEGVWGLDDKRPGARRGSRKVDLATMRLVRELQENPGLGEFRIHAALKRLGIELSPRTCGRILAINRRLYGLSTPAKREHEPKPMPFQASRRHQYWTVDIRYLDHSVDDENIYCISILENYSRAMLASAISRKQDLTAYLMVLYAAIRQHGAPEALVSDGGGVFRAKHAQSIYERLGIRKLEIEPRQAWQSYIETQFNVQRRMADWHFGTATSWMELLDAHDHWVVEFNYQVHWAHRKREDARQSPAEVLSWVVGRPVEPSALHRVFYATRFGRVLNQLGYARFRHWRVYGERGLAGETAALWLYRGHLTVAFADEALAEYQVRYQPDDHHLVAVTEGALLPNAYASPQPWLWELGPTEWLRVIPLEPYAPQQSKAVLAALQLSFALADGGDRTAK
jgi:putative transposase